VAALDAGAAALGYINFSAFDRTALIQEPFPYMIVPGFVPAAMLPAVSRDYPAIERGGSFPLRSLDYGPAFAALVAELEGPAMRAAVARKFAIDLAGRPTMVTARGQSTTADGHIHADAPSKLITLLLYMNEAWETPGGRLRLLRGPDDLEDAVAEVPPIAGTLLAFRVTPNSWHGHKLAVGPRRVVQLNWVTGRGVVRRERFRHELSARIKRLLG
jgi:SM-20-related protein